jgi:hypothetical protein
LFAPVQGAVLELSAGTGRNLAHYPYTLMSSLTLTDLSQPMLKQVCLSAFECQRWGYLARKVLLVLNTVHNLIVGYLK